jgi:hypothetical protein
LAECAVAVEEGIVVAEGAVGRVDDGGAFDAGVVDPDVSRTQVAADVVKCIGASLTDIAVKEELVTFATDSLIGGL